MNFEDIYKENVMIICLSPDESDKCREFLSEYGVKWASGQDVIDCDYWTSRTTRMGYVFHEWDNGDLRLYWEGDPSVLDNAAEYNYTAIMFNELNLTKAPVKEFDTSSLMELYQIIFR